MIQYKMDERPNTRAFPWFGALVILNALDLLYTRQILVMGGEELNPIFGWLFPSLSMVQAIIVTKCAALGLLATVWKYVPKWIQIALDILYSGVVLYSLSILL